MISELESTLLWCLDNFAMFKLSLEGMSCGAMGMASLRLPDL